MIMYFYIFHFCLLNYKNNLKRMIKYMIEYYKLIYKKREYMNNGRKNKIIEKLFIGKVNKVQINLTQQIIQLD